VEGVIDQDLARLARAHDVATGFTDWRGEHNAVPAGTLVAVLDALGVDASSPTAVRNELERLDAENRTRLLPPVVVYRAGGVPVESFTGGEPGSARVGILPDEIWIPVNTDAPTQVRVELDHGDVITLRGEPADAGLHGAGGDAVRLAPDPRRAGR
jgi:4-alpha-glucanotransferase